MRKSEGGTSRRATSRYAFFFARKPRFSVLFALLIFFPFFFQFLQNRFSTMFRTRRMCHLRDNSYFSIRNRMRSRLHSFETNFRAFLSRPLLCNIYGVHIWTFPSPRAVTCSGRGGARAKNEDSNASVDPPTGALLVMSAAGTDERAPLLLGADAASGGWGWRKRALAGLAILGTVAACVCAVAATGAPLLPSTIARAS